jgi:hypothetical protein
MSTLNAWSVVHFVEWLFMGKFILEDWRIFTLLSIGWEMLELVLPYEFAVETYNNKMADLVINALGFACGLNMR